MANEAMGSCVIEVGGQQFQNFTKMHAERSKDNMTCSGTIELSWPGSEMMGATSMPVQQLIDGAKGTLRLDGQLAATFRIDKRTSKGSADSYSLTLNYRGLTAALVDSQADHPSGQENKKKAPDIIKKLMEGYEPQLKDKSGGSSKVQERFIIQEGESVERAIRRCGREFGLLATEDEEGNLVLQKRGDDEGNGQPLILGQNFTEWTTSRDITPRASKVKVRGSSIPTDEKYGKVAEADPFGEAKDTYVPFKKETRIFVDSDQDKDTLKDRAKQEVNRRKAQGLMVSLTMSTWSDDGGTLWKVGKIHHITIPVDNVDDDLQIKSVSFDLEAETREASLEFVDKEAYGSGDSASKKDSGSALVNKGDTIFNKGGTEGGPFA